MHTLVPAQWQARAAAHEARLAPFLDAHLARRTARVKHPVHDFLFVYYSHKPAALRRWHPGFGTALVDAEAYAGLKGYEVTDGVAAVTPAYVATQRVLLTTLQRLLRATLGRAGHFGCFGLHEWAMVYRLEQGETRHSSWPLRLGGEATDRVVESHRITCSHFDAFRFFTPPARGLNTLTPGRDDRADFEQPGCLHASMDLYKHAFRLSPMIGSDLVADCFELAREIRILDMRAAPYDLTGLWLDDEEFTPVRVETAEGKAEYAALQREFAERAAPLRRRLLAEVDRLLAVVPADGVATPA
ncbi:3-methyladenine DNA glycosylase [Nocardioides sp. Y6]|uniref:3-methyladenine DNA glycosylase n=1 Tax=Nocardioides malaquae TaxID=2773426 RepID=A0ABR9RPH0_9ACTN|nr:3-methyladenine DNA glycosylase [Nocardioides malaquae]MBE7323403.1 3-methyladenine DNA glycosylase [Nocardioides malaquae]